MTDIHQRRLSLDMDAEDFDVISNLFPYGMRSQMLRKLLHEVALKVQDEGYGFITQWLQNKQPFSVGDSYGIKSTK